MQNIQDIRLKKFMEGYRLAAIAAFLLVLTGTLFLGRAFSIQKLFTIGSVPFYVTDTLMIFIFPWAVAGLASLRRTSRVFFRPFIALLVMGCLYLAWGVLVDKSGFALRGVVLSVYLLLVPFLLKMFSFPRRLDIFFALIIFCNIVNGVLGWYGVFYSPKETGSLWAWVVENSRGFNDAFFYGMTVSFILAYSLECASRLGRVFIWVLMAINLYLIVCFGIRSAWVAIVGLMIFYFILYRTRWASVLATILIVTALAAGIFSFAQKNLVPRSTDYKFLYRLEVLGIPVMQDVDRGKKAARLSQKSDGARSVDGAPEAGISSPVVEAASVASPFAAIERGTPPSPQVPEETPTEDEFRYGGISSPFIEEVSTVSPSVNAEKEGPRSSEGAKASTSLDLAQEPGTPAPVVAEVSVASPERKTVLSPDSQDAPVVFNEFSAAECNVGWRFLVWEQTWKAAWVSPIWGRGFSTVLRYDRAVTGNPIQGFSADSGIVPPP